MLIRRETEADFPAIYQFVKTAFETAKVSDEDEQNFVNRLRAGKNYLPELSLVAELDGNLSGHIMLSKLPVTGSADLNALLLAPIAVKLSGRGTGIGGALIKEGFKRARVLGYSWVALLGDANYYGRFGFKRADSFGLSFNEGLPAEHVLACELSPGALQNTDAKINFLGI